MEGNSGLALLLIPALTGGTQQQLSAALGGMVDVPVVAAARRKGDVGCKQPALGVRQGVQEGIPLKESGIRRVGFPGAEGIGRLKASLVSYFMMTSSCFQSCTVR